MWKVLERLYDKLTEIFRKIIVPSVPEYLFGCGVNQQVHVVVGKSRQYSNLQTKWYHKLSSHACMWVSHPHFVLSLIFLLSFPFLLVGLSFLARSKSLSLSCYRCIFVSLIPSDNHFKEVSTFMLACSMIFWLLWYPLRPTLDQASTTIKKSISLNKKLFDFWIQPWKKRSCLLKGSLVFPWMGSSLSMAQCLQSRPLAINVWKATKSQNLHDNGYTTQNCMTSWLTTDLGQRLLDVDCSS